MKTLLIDGDEFLFRTAAAQEVDIEWDENTHTRTLNVAAAWQTVREQMKTLMRRFQTRNVVFALTGSENWRKRVLPSYKSNRAGTKKPCGFAALRELALQHPSAKMVRVLEADDILGMRATVPGAETIIVSSDKDMKSIPGTLYNPTKDELIEVSVEEADLYHLTQTLTGDPSDGYAGCPGIGPVKAAKILASEDRWAAIVEAYEKAGLCEAEALVQARVARILRYGEFNTRTGEVKLWTPK